MNGVEFLTRVKEIAPTTQRIMLTGQADQQAIEEAINRSEVFRFISKPWNDAQLLLTVKSAFEQYTLVSENSRLYELTSTQNTELRQLNADLEARVMQRTQMLSRAKREWELTFDAIESPLAAIETDTLQLRRVNLAAAKVMSRKFTDVQAMKCHEFIFGYTTPCPNCKVTSPTYASWEFPKDERTWVAQVYPMEVRVVRSSCQATNQVVPAQVTAGALWVLGAVLIASPAASSTVPVGETRTP
jgi:two-component system NtrC family sensor kinase